ncbi:MAG: hypothetical protein WBD75_09190 [Phycisphaerae bacterium]
MKKNSKQAENMRAEYTSLCSYYAQVISFRFTLLGFFIAAVALVLTSENVPFSRGLVLIGISVPVWFIEIRNRQIFHRLLRRGMEIEDKWYGLQADPGTNKEEHRHAKPNGEEPFCHQGWPWRTIKIKSA